MHPGARFARGAAIPRGDGARPPVRLRLRLRREVDPLRGTVGAPESPYGDRHPHPQVFKEEWVLSDVKIDVAGVKRPVTRAQRVQTSFRTSRLLLDDFGFDAPHFILR